MIYVKSSFDIKDNVILIFCIYGRYIHQNLIKQENIHKRNRLFKIWKPVIQTPFIIYINSIRNTKLFFIL